MDAVATTGQTALYDALCTAAEQLKEFGERFPQCKRWVSTNIDHQQQRSQALIATVAMAFGCKFDVAMAYT